MKRSRSKLVSNRSSAVRRKNNERALQKNAELWRGQPVCVLMKDGSYYVGEITGVDAGYLSVAGCKGRGRLSPTAQPQVPTAQVSGLMDMIFGGSGTADSNPDPGMTDTRYSPGSTAVRPQSGWASLLPTIKIGINMLQTIMPLLSVFKI